jgi:3-methyladenine DNA glycosylase AlkD
MNREIINEIKTKLVKNTSNFTEEQRSRMYKILNSDNPNFIGYGNKHSEIEKLVREIHKKYQLSYEGACEIFKELVKSDVHDEKISGLFLLNRFKRLFNRDTISIFFNAISKHCDNWAFCDTSCIRVIGPFLAKNVNLAGEVIEIWSNSKAMWVRRASMVILLKIIMVKKDFKNTYVFDIVEKNGKIF